MKKFYTYFISMVLIHFITISTIEAKGYDSIYCRANFTFKVDSNINTIAAGMAYQFIDQSKGNIVRWHWEFGDSTESWEQNPMHVYTHPMPPFNNPDMPWVSQPYQRVCLSVYSSDSCSSSYCTYVPLFYVPKCGASFNFYQTDSIRNVINSPDNPTSTVSYQFYDSSFGNVVSHYWDFGDGSSSTEANPLHVFIPGTMDSANCNSNNCLQGNFQVCLTVKTSDSCTSTYCKTINIIEKPTDCIATFKYEEVLNTYPTNYLFYGNANKNVTNWFWNFGDGAYAYDRTPMHIFQVFPMPYPVDTFLWNSTKNIHDTTNYKNKFQVCLTIYTSDGCSNTYCDYVLVNQADTIHQICNSRIKITTSSILGDMSCTGSATAQLVDKYGNTIGANGYLWSNGEVTSSISELCPNYTYSVVVIDKEGCTSAGSFALMDYSSAPLVPGGWEYQYNDSIYLLKFNYYLNNPSYKCEWHFGDGTIEQGTVVPYKSNGSNTSVTVIISDQEGNEIYRDVFQLSTIEPHHNSVNDITVKAFPNPVKDVLYLDFKDNVTDITVQIYNASGKMVLEQIFKNNVQDVVQIPVGRLPNGLYICKILAGSVVYPNVKFVK